MQRQVNYGIGQELYMNWAAFVTKCPFQATLTGRCCPSQTASVEIGEVEDDIPRDGGAR